MNRLNTIHNIIYGSLRPWHRDNLMKPDEYWKEKTVDTKKKTPFNNSLFFSPRLRYYQSVIDLDIDQFISEATRTVETTKSENIALLKMKDTREAVEAFAKAAITEQRMTGIKPDDILNDNADLFEQQDKKETFIIMDYMIVALARCYFSMQNVCSKSLSDDRALDLATFCTSILGRQRLSLLSIIKSDKELIGGSNTPAEIKKTPKTKKTNDDTTAYTLYYSYSGSDKPRRLNGVLNILIEEKWIEEDTTPDNFFDFFSNKVWHCNIKWTASASVLSTFLDELSKQPFIKLRKECTMALIAKNQFGKSFDYRGTTDKHKIEIINTCISILNPKLRLSSSPDFDNDDDAPFLKAQIREAGFETRKNGHWGKK